MVASTEAPIGTLARSRASLTIPIGSGGGAQPIVNTDAASIAKVLTMTPRASIQPMWRGVYPVPAFRYNTSEPRGCTTSW